MIGEGQARRFDVIRGIGIKASPAGVIGKLDVIRSLRQIEVVDSTLSHDDIECLKQCHALVELCLAGTGITDEACALLALRKKIQVLSLSRENGITTSGINSFNMASLQRLSLLDCHNVVEPIDEILRAAPQLSGLELAGSQFSDRSIEAASTCPLLTEIHLRNLDVSDAGLGELSNAPQLQQVFLSGSSRVTERGIAAILGKPQFRFFLWSEIGVDEQSFAELQSIQTDFTWRGTASYARVRRK